MFDELPEGFAELVNVQPSGCWWWMGNYFEGTPDFRGRAAFVASWEVRYGPVPTRHRLYQLCAKVHPHSAIRGLKGTTRVCVNPDHRIVALPGSPRGFIARSKAKQLLANLDDYQTDLERYLDGLRSP